MSEAEPIVTGDDGASAAGDATTAAGPDPQRIPESAFTWFVEDYVKPTAIQILVYAAKNPWDFIYTLVLCLAPFFAISAYLSYR